MDPLFQQDSPSADYLLDKQFENDLSIDEESHKAEVEGYLCSELPRSLCPPNVDFYFYSSTLVAQKFLLTGKLNELRSNAEIRTSLKILALKYLSAVGSIYTELVNVTACIDGNYRQSISDLHQLLLSDDESLCILAFSLFANLENTHHRSGEKFPHFYPTG